MQHFPPPAEPTAPGRREHWSAAAMIVLLGGYAGTTLLTQFAPAAVLARAVMPITGTAPTPLAADESNACARPVMKDPFASIPSMRNVLTVIWGQCPSQPAR